MQKVLIYSLLLLGAASTQAQLAITEATSSASTNLTASVRVTQNSDFWELSNFGTNAIDLTGYRFDDSDNNLAGADSSPFNGLTIGAGESIIFVQTDTVTTPQQFRDWWGTNLPANLQIVFYSGNGLSSSGDGLRLWNSTATDVSDVVDSVDFGAATRGSTFVYSPVTGQFTNLSTNGTGGAFKAVTADDFGSPGFTTGPVPLAFLQQPTNKVVNPGDTFAFVSSAQGLPRAKYQWQFNSVDISGATKSSLTVTNIQTTNAGNYRVVVTNSVQTITSSNALLTITGAAVPPSLITAPSNRAITIGQSATFSAAARGSPQPAFQWKFNGTNIMGATTGQLTISGAQTNDSGVYTVIASNFLGTAQAQATLTVTRKPNLVVTEVMSSAFTTPVAGHGDWWEVSNLDDFPVNLQGYRLDDNSATLAAAATITDSVILAPGESVVLMEGPNVAAFRQWWGPNRLANTKIIGYVGSGLGLSSGGDAVILWNSGAIDDSDYICIAIFSAATSGVSFTYNPETAQFGELSADGGHGAFVAAENGDIGSPGVIDSAHLNPPLLGGIAVATNEFKISWQAETNRNYTLLFKNSLTETNWTTLTNFVSPGGPVIVSDVAPASEKRFYRLMVAP